MNYKVVFKLLGVILCALEASFVLSFVVGIYFGDDINGSNSNGWYISIGITFALIVLCFVFNRNSKKALFKKEAFAVVGVGWILSSVIGALPYYFSLQDCSFVDAFFESSSGLTTTGATIFTDVESLPHSILIWRTMSQWIGGLGIVVFFVAILSFLGAGAKILYSREASGNLDDFKSARVQSSISLILFVYLLLSVVCTFFYFYGGMGFFDALCHMFSTVSTGGFSNYNVSMAEFDSPFIEWSSIVFMILGGTNFMLILSFLRLEFSKIRENEEFIFYLFLILLFTLLIVFIIYQQSDIIFMHAVRTSMFQVVSIMTTTGYSSIDFNALLPFAHICLLILMVLGGCSGSTAGGVKIIRSLTAFKVVFYNVEQSFRKNLIRPINISGKPLDESSIEDVIVYMMLIAIMSLLSLPVLSIMEPAISVEGIISAFFACFFNIGPGFAEVGPMHNYAFMHPQTKVFLSILMIAGRLELYAILALCFPSLWRKFT